jgi:hypothetical protein
VIVKFVLDIPGDWGPWILVSLSLTVTACVWLTRPRKQCDDCHGSL